MNNVSESILLEGSEVRYWFTPDGKYVNAGPSHENWIRQNDPSVKVGATLIDTYENAIEKGYVRGIYEPEMDFLFLSNLPNYDCYVPKIKPSVKRAIEQFIEDKKVSIVANGKGRMLTDFDTYNMEESDVPSISEVAEFRKLQEGWKDLASAAAIALTPLTPTSVRSDTPHLSAYNNQPSSTLNSSFVNYIKRVENNGKVGYDSTKKLWFPHKSVEGGRETIAYGHKITPDENFKNGITDRQAEELLRKDLEKARARVRKEIPVPLSNKQEEMFVDFVFNMGTLQKFPKFVKAVLSNDMNRMKGEYKRYAGQKELVGRNKAFLSRFLNEYFGFNYYF